MADRRGQPKVPTESEIHGGTTRTHQDIGTTKSNNRARWSHQMKLFLIGLLKDHDVPGYRTHNAWSKDAWTRITCRLNDKFGVTFTVNQVKQKEQDLKKDYRSVKDLIDESGFGWDSDRNMVDAPNSVWDSFAARKNSKDALQWRDRSFPYYDELVPLYEGRYADGRTRHRTRQGMDHYASKAKHGSVPSSHPTQGTDWSQSPSHTMPIFGEADMPLNLDEEVHEDNLDSGPQLSTPIQHRQVAPRSTRGKRQKRDVDDGFHERYLKLKKEEIDRFVAIEEKKLEDPYNINKCITTIEGLNGLQLGDMLMASDIFKTCTRIWSKKLWCISIARIYKIKFSWSMVLADVVAVLMEYVYHLWHRCNPTKLKTIDKLGKAGEVVKVAPGHFRNHLMPKMLAVPNINKFAILMREQRKLHQHEEEEVVKEITKEDDDARQQEEKLKEFHTAAKRLDKALLVFRRFISEGSELRTPVTKDEVVSEVARQLNINIHPDNLHMQSPLSSLGEFELPIRLPKSIPRPEGKLLWTLKIKIRRP